MSRQGQDPATAMRLLAEATTALERQIDAQRWDLAPELATAHVRYGTLLAMHRELEPALRHGGRAVTLMETLVLQNGRFELAGRLAAVYSGTAGILKACGQSKGALALYDRAVDRFQTLLNREGRRDLLGHWAVVRAQRAALLHGLGAADDARREARDVRALIQDAASRDPSLTQAQELIGTILRDVPR